MASAQQIVKLINYDTPPVPSSLDKGFHPVARVDDIVAFPPQQILCLTEEWLVFLTSHSTHLSADIDLHGSVLTTHLVVDGMTEFYVIGGIVQFVSINADTKGRSYGGLLEIRHHVTLFCQSGHGKDNTVKGC